MYTYYKEYISLLFSYQGKRTDHKKLSYSTKYSYILEEIADKSYFLNWYNYINNKIMRNCYHPLTQKYTLVVLLTIIKKKKLCNRQIKYISNFLILLLNMYTDNAIKQEYILKQRI